MRDKKEDDHPHLIERCEAATMGVQCVLPVGHAGDHESHILLPPDVGQMIDQHVTALEVAEHRLKITRRWLYGAVAINVLGAIYNLFGIIF
jgi:hypothetical protein